MPPGGAAGMQQQPVQDPMIALQSLAMQGASGLGGPQQQQPNQPGMVL